MSTEPTISSPSNIIEALEHHVAHPVLAEIDEGRLQEALELMRGTARLSLTPAQAKRIQEILGRLGAA